MHGYVLARAHTHTVRTRTRVYVLARAHTHTVRKRANARTHIRMCARAYSLTLICTHTLTSRRAGGLTQTL